MKLQLALDMVGWDEAIGIVSDLQHVLDIVEVGTPWLMRDGLGTVRKLKERFPVLTILADMKIIDAGRYEADDAFAAGADIVTAMAVAHDATIAGAVEAGRKHGGQIMTDLLVVHDVKTRAREMVELGVDYVCVHTAFDVQSATMTPLEELELAAESVGGERVAVAGGVNMETLPAVVAERPEIIIVGGYLTNKRGSDRTASAEKMKEMMTNVN